MSETSNRSPGGRLKRGFEKKVLIPVATTIVSAAASYLIKKLPLILEEKLLPKLREKDAPRPVVNALEQTASTLGGEDPPAEADDASPAKSNDDREEQRREREKRRSERKRAAAKAA